MISAVDAIVLPPDLEQFAIQAVASGKYRDTADIVRTGIDLLRRRDTARAAFLASLEAAQRDSEQTGFHHLDDVLDELDAIIVDEERGQT